MLNCPIAEPAKHKLHVKPTSKQKPVSHHLKAPHTNRIDNLGSFIHIGNLEFLLKKDRSLLIGRLDDTHNERLIRWGRGRMQKREKVDWLGRD